MNVANVNGVVLDERISKKLSVLQDGYSNVLASGLDDAIGYLLEENWKNECSDSKVLINVLSTLHNAKTEFLALIPQKQEGGQQ